MIKRNLFAGQNLEISFTENCSCIYRFLEGNTTLYVGQARRFGERMKSHYHLSPECYARIDRIEVIPTPSRELNKEEQLQISHLKPIYNVNKTNKPVPMYTWISTDWHEVDYTTKHIEECKRLFKKLFEKGLTN